MIFAHVAQSAEHILGKDEVTGSIPVMGLTVAKAFLSLESCLKIKVWILKPVVFYIIKHNEHHT